MKQAKWIFSLSLIVALSVGLFVACDKNMSINPAEQHQIESGNVTILSVPADQGLKKMFSGQQQIGPAGGTITVGDSECGYSSIVFPQNALNTTLNISMYWRSEDMLQADFFPEGTIFNESVYIRLSYKDVDLTGIDENDLAIYYYNPVNENWELVSDNVNTQEKYVEGHCYLEYLKTS